MAQNSSQPDGSFNANTLTSKDAPQQQHLLTLIEAQNGSASTTSKQALDEIINDSMCF